MAKRSARSEHPVANTEWRTPLSKPIRLKDGKTLRTLEDAAQCAMYLAKRRPEGWDDVAEALVSAAEDPTPANVKAATSGISAALFLRHMLARGVA